MEGQLADSTAVIQMDGIPAELAAMALVNRGITKILSEDGSAGAVA